MDRETSQPSAGETSQPSAAQADPLGRLEGKIDAMTNALQRHLLSCERRHGPLDPRLGQMEQALAAQTEAVARMEPRLRRLEDEATAEGAQRLHGRVQDLEKAETARVNRESAENAERTLLVRLAPLLLPVGGGATTVAVIELAQRVWGG